MKSSTVDLVVAGTERTVIPAALDAVSRGKRVLIVLRSGDARAMRRVRQYVCRGASAAGSRLRVMTNAEVVCVDGVGSVEAVVIRYARTGRLYAVNASACLLNFFACV